MTQASTNTIQSLRAENVSLAFGDTNVVDAVSLTLAPGQTTALLGNSGAGKSTLLRLFAGLEQPDAGTIWCGDACQSSPDKMVRAEERRVGLIFQDFALFPHLTLLGNVMFGLNKLAKPDARKKAMDWLERINLSRRANDYPHQLSGGEQQRVAIARALVPDPIAILMDEPFSGLDPALREDVRSAAMQIIKDAGIPALLVTHDAIEAMTVADQLSIMRDGRIVQSGTPTEVYTQPVDKAAATALGPVIVLPASWNDEKTHLNTPFGAVFHTFTPGQHTVYARPEAFFPDAASQITVQVRAVNRRGHALFATIERQGHIIDIPLPAHINTSPNTTISLSLNQALCSVF